LMGELRYRNILTKEIRRGVQDISSLYAILRGGWFAWRHYWIVV
jgi:hypothetical protein